MVNSGFVAGGFTNASGVYSISVPPGALYYVATDTTSGYLVEAFPDVQCVSNFCGPNDLREAEPFAMLRRRSGDRPELCRSSEEGPFRAR